MEAAVASGILKIVGNKLAPLLMKEYSSIVGAKKDLQKLHGQVVEIDHWLESVGDKAVGNDPSFNWLKVLKDIAYEVDDLVDEFQLKVEKHETGGDGGIVSKYPCNKPKSIIFQCKVATKIKAIKKKFAAVVKQRNDFSTITNSLLVGHRPVRHMNMIVGEMPLLPNIDAASILGRDKDKHELISKLVEVKDQQIIDIVSIIGLGGSGKTTLAKLVFNDGHIIDKHFEVKLWVHVSQDFDVAKLVGKLFEAIAGEKSEQYPLQQMSKKISGNLTGKRYLLVLDDVWTKNQILWDQFMVHLKNGTPGSAILLTMRSREVAGTIRSIDQFDLPFLSPGDSWQLFQQTLGMPEKHLESEFVEVGKEILNKCGGVPLAIKVMAGVLSGKKLIGEWQAMRDSNLLDVEDEEASVSISACLMLSYFHLPSHMKQCFTICSVFPKGYMIDKEQLIDQWIAHDMIIPEAGVEYLEYVGQKYFNSLVQMSFLQDVAEDFDGRVKCRMHDLVHDLSRSILDDKISLIVPKEATGSTMSYRYLSLTKEAINRTRSYIYSSPSEESIDLPPSEESIDLPKNIFRKARGIYVDEVNDESLAFGKAFSNARHLRSITVEYLYRTKIFTAILQVECLKCLQILHCEEELPEAISDLWSLQALHVTSSYRHFELPKSIGKLQKLRTLNLSECSHLNCLPDSIGDCHMLSTIDLSGCSWFTVLPNSIGRNKKLRVLRLHNTGIERLPSSITTLRNLEFLDLHSCWKLAELPEGIGNLEKLEVLNLKKCENLGGMPVGIRQLSRLQKLGLFVVGEGTMFAGISELANISKIGEKLSIRILSHGMVPDDAHKARLNQKTNLQRLDIQWWAYDVDKLNTELEQAVLDGLEPPPGIKNLKLRGYSGRQYARWMQTQVGGGVQRLAHFPFLRVMRLYDFPNLKNLHGLVELPCLEELELINMPSLESISGGPFPSLVRLEMRGLPRLGEVWMVTEGAMPQEVGCCKLGKVRVGYCLTKLVISGCPNLNVKPHLPSSLQDLGFTGSSSESLQVRHSDMLTELPESLGSLTSLRSLRVFNCSGIRVLPESIGELRSLQKLTIYSCNSMRSLPQSMGHLTSLQSLDIGSCDALQQLPDCLGELCSLRKLEISCLPGLTCLPQSICHLTTSLQELKISRCPGIISLPEGIKDLTALQQLSIYQSYDLQRRCQVGREDWHLVSHIPDKDIRDPDIYWSE